MQIEGEKLERVLQFVILTVTWGEHSTPCKPCVGSPEISQEAERVRKNTAESPAVSAGGNW